MRKALISTPPLLLVLVALFLVLRPDSPDSNVSAEESQEEVMFDLEIQDGAMNPSEIVVDEGDQVRLRMISDRPTEIHFHGYDLDAEIEPDAIAELSFEATITGRFEIENHSAEPHEVLGELLVQPR